MAASLGVSENAGVVVTISAGPTVVDFSVASAGDVAGRLRDSGLSTTHLSRFNGDAPVAAEVGNKVYLVLLWQAVDSAEMRSLERLLAGAFHSEGMVQEEAGCSALAQILLLSPRLVSIGGAR